MSYHRFTAEDGSKYGSFETFFRSPEDKAVSPETFREVGDGCHRDGPPDEAVNDDGDRVRKETVMAKNEVFRDPSVKQEEAWRVHYNGQVLRPSFNSKGAAQAYLDGLHRGDRKPEYPAGVGWYWWACFPGCMPDGEAFGPFETEEKAIQDALDH